KKICDAMAALAAAIPGASERRGMTQVCLHQCAEVGLRLLVENGGRRETYESDDGSHEWDSVTLYAGTVSVTAYGKHRPIARAEIDSAAVESALALAEEAVGG